MDATYVHNNEFVVAGDRTSEFVADRRVKLDCGTDGIKYATVVSSSYLSPNTTVIIDESTLTNKLVSALYGIVQPGEYGSLPDHSHDGTEGSGGSLTCEEHTVVSGGSSTTVSFSSNQSDENYYIIATLKNVIDSPPSVYSYIVSETTVSGFTVLFSDTIDTGNYILDWHLMR